MTFKRGLIEQQYIVLSNKQAHADSFVMSLDVLQLKGDVFTLLTSWNIVSVFVRGLLDVGVLGIL